MGLLSARNHLGNSATLAPPAVGPGFVDAPLINIQPGDVNGSSMCDPVMVTVDVSKRIILQAAAGTDHRVQLVATWGTGGHATPRAAIFDARHGARITLPASSLTVIGRYIADAVAAIGPTVELSLAVGYGERAGHAAAPTFTDPPQAVAAGALSAAVALPAYAARAAWTSIADPLGFVAPAATIQLSGDPAFTTVLAQFAPSAGEFVPIPAGVEFVRFRNDGAATTHRLIYELDL